MEHQQAATIDTGPKPSHLPPPYSISELQPSISMTPTDQPPPPYTPEAADYRAALLPQQPNQQQQQQVVLSTRIHANNISKSLFCVQGRRQGLGVTGGRALPPALPNPPTAKILREYIRKMYKNNAVLRIFFINFWPIFVIFPRNFPQGVIIVPKMPE